MTRGSTHRQASAALASIAVAMTLAATLPERADAQVRYRRPFSSDTAPITAHFDTNGPGGGLADYVCGGRTYDGHTGTDFGIPIGTPILAGAAGRVISVMTGCPDVGYVCSPCGGLCGNQVRLRHADGSETLYCHMQSGGMRVSVGADVACGQTIGHSASSGCSSGPHLHFGFHASAGAAADDPFRGACGGPETRWNDQRGYPQTPGASCGCTPSAEVCNGVDDDCNGSIDDGVSRACSSACGGGTEACAAGAWGACSAPSPTAESCNGVDDDCDARTDEGDLCEVDLLHAQPSAYAAPSSTDVNADGRSDLCARAGAGLRCWTASASGWSAPWAEIPWSDANGWDDVTNYATLRMGDLNGDGRADVCARSDADLLCALSNGTGFDEPTVWRAGLSDANAWNRPEYYTTLRLADVDGDGREDLCARDSQGFGCWLSDGARFEQRIDGPRWSDAAGFGAAMYYGTLRMGDVDGDRRADVCVRGAVGMQCVLSDGAGFPTSLSGPEWSDALGWGAMQYWSTIQLADVDGDGRADLCGRSSADLRCVLATDDGFSATHVVVGELSNANGWDDLTNYATLRVGDVDGDDAADLCLRGDVRMGCWAWNGTAFVQRDGPEWSDVGNWNAAGGRYYQTIRLADFDGDGLADLCARGGAGWRCHPSTGEGFGEAVTFDELTDPGGWTEHRHWSTILSAGRACLASAELCNDRDDDCDGEIDEGSVCDPDAGTGARDGAVSTRDGGADRGPDGALSSGCTCRAGGRSGSPPALVIGLFAIAALLRRRR